MMWETLGSRTRVKKSGRNSMYNLPKNIEDLKDEFKRIMIHFIC